MLYQRDSTDLHLKATRRFSRLARKLKGASTLAEGIVPFHQKLIDRHKQTLLADERREDAYDDILYADQILDDTIRTVFDNAKLFERNNPGQQVIVKIFPNGTFSEIVNMPYADEPAAAERIAASIDMLGNQHVLFPLAAELRSKIADVNNAMAEYKNVITELTRAEVEEETAKADLRKQYEFTYLDGRKILGAKLVERIFPVLTNRTKSTEAEVAQKSGVA